MEQEKALFSAKFIISPLVIIFFAKYFFYLIFLNYLCKLKVYLQPSRVR